MKFFKTIGLSCAFVTLPTYANFDNTIEELVIKGIEDNDSPAFSQAANRCASLFDVLIPIVRERKNIDISDLQSDVERLQWAAYYSNVSYEFRASTGKIDDKLKAKLQRDSQHYAKVYEDWLNADFQPDGTLTNGAAKTDLYGCNELVVLMDKLIPLYQ